ncbi:AT-hook motif nuclear-localized protein 7-like [Diospyros lotus]|uniref:AT-hook motif nuclear-localized protein 7-like n=1 Tax=Diospyros lotus TaxID=55363 RepID=UPI0022501516|nr:AT-hook motif nuclear-localized protein 7-like [Diospyros lotus]XP_052172069.1 AT-hook motif nuclear-localized protein 7-like [Diospyros lotus]
MEDKGSAGYGSAPSNPGTEPAPASGGGGMVPQVMRMAAVDTAGGGVPASGAGSMAIVPGGSGDLSVKKKRGRPRKYDSDGNLRVPYVSTTPPPPGFTFSPPSSEFSSKRGRGRPPGSGNWQLLASLGELFANTAGGDFTPHVVTVNTGEDVAAKILSFSQKGPRGICVLSANGAVSNVTIRQPGSSGGLLTYEGRFEILSLSGSFTISENGGVRSRTGGLSVSLAGPDGRVIGGGIAGLLMAASPIQMVVGSFMPNGFKAHKRKHQYEPRTTPAALGSPDMVTQATPISQAAPARSFSPLPASHFSVHDHGEADNNIDKHNINSTPDSAEWNDLEPASPQRPSPDINVSVLVD